MQEGHPDLQGLRNLIPQSFCLKNLERQIQGNSVYDCFGADAPAFIFHNLICYFKFPYINFCSPYKFSIFGI